MCWECWDDQLTKESDMILCPKGGKEQERYRKIIMRIEDIPVTKIADLIVPAATIITDSRGSGEKDSSSPMQG